MNTSELNRGRFIAAAILANCSAKMIRIFVSLLLASLACSEARSPPPQWRDWLTNFGHDTFQYPSWIVEQMGSCNCAATSATTLSCVDTVAFPNADVTFCTAKQWLLDHMPEFDKHYLPPSVTVKGASMFDDNIAFSLMAMNASAWTSNIPVDVRLAYILPYASYHEARSNWRPLFFAKFFSLVENAATVEQAMNLLASPSWEPTTAPSFTNWTAYVWDDYPKINPLAYHVQWSRCVIHQ